MKQFTDKDFLLSTNMAKALYHDFAENMPIPDYYYHISPQEAYEDRKSDTITQVWLGGDHYKRRQMRSNGVDGKYVAGDGMGREKFQVWVETIPKLIGNPLYHWSHLELRKYSGYQGCLNGDTAEEIWNLCNMRLQGDSMTVHNLIKQSDVTLICTTDDPVGSPERYEETAEDDTFDIQVLLTWRPDKAMNAERPTFGTYMAQLPQASGVQVTDSASLKEALKKRTAFLASMGYCVSDHTLEYVMYASAADSEVDAIPTKGLKGEAVSKEEELKFKTAFMLSVIREYNAMGWIMQIHYGYKRDSNGYMFEKLGIDTGFGYISNYAPSAQMADSLNALSTNNEISKTILYSLNPNNNAPIGTIIGCFQEKFPGKIQQNSAWWSNDHKTSMTEQMTSLVSLECLGNFIDILTDSRSFLSYTRYEYFRHILCNLISGWTENDEYLVDTKMLEEIIEDVCYNNSAKYFGFRLDEVK